MYMYIYHKCFCFIASIQYVNTCCIVCTMYSIKDYLWYTVTKLKRKSMTLKQFRLSLSVRNVFRSVHVCSIHMQVNTINTEFPFFKCYRLIHRKYLLYCDAQCQPRSFSVNDSPEIELIIRIQNWCYRLSPTHFICTSNTPHDYS